MPDSTEFSFPHMCFAWTVHLLTAAGAAAGLMAVIAIAHAEWMHAFSWMAITLLIDSCDGMLARACRVKEVLPQFDGALLDNIVDYFTYVMVPAFFIYESGIVPDGFALACALAITLSSGYQFCQADAKTADHCFKGFPSYWNIVVFYLFMLALPGWLNTAVLLCLAIAVFVPVKYLYPSRTLFLRPLTLMLSTAWGLVLAVILLYQLEGHTPLLYVSLAYVAYYLSMSAYLTARGVHLPGLR